MHQPPAWPTQSLDLDPSGHEVFKYARVGPGNRVRLDCGQVGSLGSRGVAELLALNNWLARYGAGLTLVNVPPDLGQLFRLTRLDAVLDVRS